MDVKGVVVGELQCRPLYMGPHFLKIHEDQ